MSNTPKRRRVYHPGKSPFASPKAVVQQHLAKEADINTIVERARRGIAPSNVRNPGVYRDVSNMPSDLTEAFAVVDSAWDSFMSLPAKAREELGNDPRRLTKAPSDFFVRHGLINPPKESPGASPGSPGGSGEGSPVSTSKKGSKAPKAQAPDLEDQD